MARRKNRQTPLGELITKARIDAGLSRAQLAKNIGIGENSLQRYEKAGLEDDGQYPPSPKLAKICFELGLSPLKVLLSSLSLDEYWTYLFKSSEDGLMGHPQHEYLIEQYGVLLSDNRSLRVLLEFLIKDKDELNSNELEYTEYLKGEARKIFEAQRKFEDAFHIMFREKKLEYSGIMFPGDERFGVAPGEDDPWLESDYAHLRKNGSDHEDPSRPLQNTSKAVDAAPNHPKKKDDQT